MSFVALSGGASVSLADTLFWTGETSDSGWNSGAQTTTGSTTFTLSGIITPSVGGNGFRYKNWFRADTPTSSSGSYATEIPRIDDDVVFANAFYSQSNPQIISDEVFAAAQSIQIVSTKGWNWSGGGQVSTFNMVRWPSATGTHTISTIGAYIDRSWVGGTGELVYRVSQQVATIGERPAEKHGPGTLVVQPLDDEIVFTHGMVVRSGTLDLRNGDVPATIFGSVEVGDSNQAAAFPSNLPHPGFMPVPTSFPTVEPAFVRVGTGIELNGSVSVKSDGVLEYRATPGFDGLSNHYSSHSGNGLVRVTGGAGQVLMSDAQAFRSFSGTVSVEGGATLVGNRIDSIGGNVNVVSGRLSLAVQNALDNINARITVGNGGTLSIDSGQVDTEAFPSLYLAGGATFANLYQLRPDALTIERSGSLSTQFLGNLFVGSVFTSNYVAAAQDVKATVSRLYFGLTESELNVQAGQLGTAAALHVNDLAFDNNVIRKTGNGTLDVSDFDIVSIAPNKLVVEAGRVNFGGQNVSAHLDLKFGTTFSLDRSLNANDRLVGGSVVGRGTMRVETRATVANAANDFSGTFEVAPDASLTIAATAAGLHQAKVRLEAPAAGQSQATFSNLANLTIEQLTSADGIVRVGPGTTLTLADADFTGRSVNQGSSAIRFVRLSGSTDSSASWKGPADQDLKFVVESQMTLNTRVDTMAGGRDLVVNDTGIVNIATLPGQVITTAPRITGTGTVNYVGNDRTIFTGSLSEDSRLVVKSGTLDLRNNAFAIAGRLIIDAGATVTMNPSTPFIFEDTASIEVAGTLAVNGQTQFIQNLILRAGGAASTAAGSTRQLRVYGFTTMAGNNVLQGNVDLRGDVLSTGDEPVVLNIAGTTDDILLSNPALISVGGIGNGVLAINGVLQLNDSTSLNFRSTKQSAAALIDLNGALTGTGSASLPIDLFIDHAVVPYEVIKLIDFTNSPTDVLLSQFVLRSVVGDAAGGSLSFDGRTLIYTAVPEPGALCVMAGAAAFLLGRRRSRDERN